MKKSDRATPPTAFPEKGLYMLATILCEVKGLGRVETRLDKRMDCLEHKLDAVAADLSAHRKDNGSTPQDFQDQG